MRKLFGFFGGAALGAALVYFLDPVSGRRRRARVREKAVRAEHEAAYGADKKRRDLSNRARGLFAELFSALQPDRADDDIIVARVRARLGQVCSHPHAIETSSSNGSVRLVGNVLGGVSLVAVLNHAQAMAGKSAD